MLFKKRDPVCNAKVSKKKAFIFMYKGKTYYFDSQACRNTFKDDPENFIKEQFSKRLFRFISKASKDVPKCCHKIIKEKMQ